MRQTGNNDQVNSLRKGRRQIGIAMVTLLLGSWMGAICQACLAHENASAAMAGQAPGAHCDSSPAQELPEFPPDYDEHCAACECDDAAAFSTDPKPGVPAEQTDQKPITLAGTDTGIPPAPARLAGLHYPPGPPFSRTSPIDTYSVQIK